MPELNASDLLTRHLVGAGGLRGNTTKISQTFTIPAGTVAADVINLVRAPAGSRFFNAEVIKDGLAGAITTMTLGYKAGALSKPAYFGSGIALNAAGRVAADPLTLDRVEDTATITATIAGATTVADTEITVIATYVSEGTN